MGQEEKDHSIRHSERVRVRGDQGSVRGIPRVSLETELIVSKVKWGYYAFNSAIMAFVIILILSVASLDTVTYNYRIGMWIISISLTLMLLYHFYSIPKILINGQSIRLKERGKIAQTIALEDKKYVKFFSQGKSIWLGALGHRIFAKNNDSILFHTSYYSNTSELLSKLDGDEEEKIKTKYPLRFTPSSLIHITKLYRSFNALFITAIALIFLYALIKNLSIGVVSDLHTIVQLVLVFLIVVLLWGLIKMTQFASFREENLIQHFPLFLASRTIPKSDVKKAKIQITRTGKGGTLRVLLVLLKNYKQIQISTELNSKQEVNKIEQWLKK